MMAIRLIRSLAAIAALMALLPVSGDAATMIRAKFIVDGLANCQQPALQNFAVRIEGTGELATDRTANLSLSSSFGGRENYTGKLGGRPSDALGGSASVRVVNRHTLQAVREYPNNLVLVYMTVIGNSCSLRVENRLKPGRRQYTFTGNMGVALCSKPRVTHAECTPY
jgi:hypothetical protein